VEDAMPTFTIQNINLAYEDLGDKNQETAIVFLNGVMASMSSWKMYTELFVNLGYRVVLHDFKGQLLSSKPEGIYTFSDHVFEMKSLLESLNVKKVHIIGTSYGSEVGMIFAMTYPEYVLSLTIIDGVSELDEVLMHTVETWKSLCQLKDGELFFKAMLADVYGNRFLRNNRTALLERAKTIPSLGDSYLEGQISLYDTFLKEVNFTHRLNEILCPTLIACGEDDLLKRPKFSRILHENIKNSEFILLPDCGHVAIFEQVEALKTCLLGFILKNDRVN
jgi:3-oxoadipate enol-lactonase